MSGPSNTRARPSATERSDIRRNRAGLLRAVRELVADDPDHLSMKDVAARAELSTATAYRYFPSVGDLIHAYREAVINELLEYRKSLTSHGTQLFEQIARERGRKNLEHGRTISRLRSHVGFLSRMDQDDPLITLTREVWEDPVREVIEEFGLPADRLPYGLFLCNLFFDAREYLDLVESGPLTPDQATDHLINAFYGALKSW